MRNCVGLSCSNDYIACGSEDGLIYIYHKDLSHPIITVGVAESMSSGTLPATKVDSFFSGTIRDDTQGIQENAVSLRWRPSTFELCAGTNIGRVIMLKLLDYDSVDSELEH